MTNDSKSDNFTDHCKSEKHIPDCQAGCQDVDICAHYEWDTANDQNDQPCLYTLEKENHLRIETGFFRKKLLQTKTKNEKDPTCAIFSKSRRFENIKYDTERGVSRISKISKKSSVTLMSFFF